MRKLTLALILLTSLVFASDEEACLDLVRAGDYKRAIELGQQLVSKNPKSYDAHLCLARGYYAVGDFRKSIEHAKKMEELASSKEELAIAYNRLGLAYEKLGELDLALMYHSRDLALSRELGDKRGESAALNNIAMIYEDKRDYQKALEFYNMSLKLTDDLKDRAPILNNIGILYDKLGNYAEAVKYLKEAVDNLERVGDYHMAGQTMLNLGNVYRKMGQYAQAERFLSEGLKRMQAVGDKYWEFTGHENFGYYYLDKREHKKALESFYKAFSIGAQGNYSEKHLMLVYMAVVLELKPELKAYLMELSGKDQKLMEEIEKVRNTEDFKTVLAKYQKPQKPETPKGKQKGKK